MKIRGSFTPITKAPFVIAKIVQEALQLNNDVRLLVDSGASSTVIADSDAARLGIDYSRLEQHSQGMFGIGGSVSTFILPDVALIFATDEGLFEEHLEKIYVMRHSVIDTRIKGIPSLLGRDVLNKYSLLLRQRTNTVLITDDVEV
jgi:hypothetical protein